MATTTPQQESDATTDRRRLVIGAVLLGVGLGGFVDGIVLHQILQWHHLVSAQDAAAGYPDVSVAELERNTFWDGVFHTATWLFVAIGLVVLWPAVVRGIRVPRRAVVGLLLAGWGLFNLVEGTIAHRVLAVHHVRDDVAESLWWDLGFLVVGAGLVGGGAALWWAATRADHR